MDCIVSFGKVRPEKLGHSLLTIAVYYTFITYKVLTLNAVIALLEWLLY